MSPATATLSRQVLKCDDDVANEWTEIRLFLETHCGDGNRVMKTAYRKASL